MLLLASSLPDGAAGMVPGKDRRHRVVQLVRHGQRQRVPDAQGHGDGRRRRGDPKRRRLGLRDRRGQQDGVGPLLQQLARLGPRVSRQEDERVGAGEVGHERRQLRGAAREGDDEDGVAGGQQAHVAVQGLGRVQEHGGDAEALERGAELSAQVTGFPDARDDELAALGAAGGDGVDGEIETFPASLVGFVESCEISERQRLGVEDVRGLP